METLKALGAFFFMPQVMMAMAVFGTIFLSWWVFGLGALILGLSLAFPIKNEETREKITMVGRVVCGLGIVLYGYFFFFFGQQVMDGNLAQIRLGVAMGFSLESKAYYSGGNTSLHVAAYYGRLKVCQYLLANGADLKALNSSQVTPLYMAVQGGNQKVVEYLLDQGADIKAKNVEGSPIHCAAHLGNLDMLKFLISRGADFNEKNRYNESVLWYAERYNHPEMATYLRGLGAK
jgi:hypothetical protein